MRRSTFTANIQNVLSRFPINMLTRITTTAKMDLNHNGKIAREKDALYVRILKVRNLTKLST